MWNYLVTKGCFHLVCLYPQKDSGRKGLPYMRFSQKNKVSMSCLTSHGQTSELFIRQFQSENLKHNWLSESKQLEVQVLLLKTRDRIYTTLKQKSSPFFSYICIVYSPLCVAANAFRCNE